MSWAISLLVIFLWRLPILHNHPRLRLATDAQADVDLVFHIVQAGGVHPPIRLQIRIFGTAREERGDDGIVFRRNGRVIRTVPRISSAGVRVRAAVKSRSLSARS